MRNVEGAVREIDCGMGLKELKREIDYFMILPEVKQEPPRWKKPVIVGSLWASGVAIGLGLTFAGSGIGLLMLVAGLGWMSIVITANSTERRRRCPNWMETQWPSPRGNARKPSGKRRCRRSVSASIVTARSSEARKRSKAMTTLRQTKGHVTGDAGAITGGAL
ncbi:MAG: hypothetical protein II008_09380 [Oscillospiraceae bacterium]|nr:hypothetical protein [Oscillospiraceae bacterium]